MQTEQTENQVHSEAQQDTEELEFDNAFDAFAEGKEDTLDPVEEQSAETSTQQHRDDQGRFASKGEEAAAEIQIESNKESGEEASLSELDQYKQNNTNWEHRYKSDLGRQSALQQQLADKDKLIEDLQKGVTQNKPTEVSDSEWDDVLKDYPELADVFGAKLTALTTEHQRQMDELRGQITPIQQRAETQYVEQQTQALVQEFPNYIETINSPEFDQWIQQQPHSVQTLMNSDEAVDASYLLKSFDQSQAHHQTPPNSPLRQKRQQQLSDAESIGNRSSRKQAVDEDDFDAAFNEFAAD